jgi:predicted nucleotidyltransferase
MTVANPVELDATAEAYVADVLDAIEEHGRVAVLGAFVLGSVALGAFERGRSDIDLTVVVDAPLVGEARPSAIEAIGRLGLPARALELVVYVRGAQPPDFDLNVNVDADGAHERPDEPRHWFVIDAAIAQERSPSFGDGDPWSAFFEPVSQDGLREALRESIAWSERQPPGDEFARLNAIRSRHYLAHGEWLSKADARKEAGR